VADGVFAVSVSGAGHTMTLDFPDANVEGFDVSSTVTFTFTARTSANASRAKSLLFELMDGSTVVASRSSGALSTTATETSVDLISPLDRTLSQFNSYTLRVTVTEGTGMPDTVTTQIDAVSYSVTYDTVFSSAGYIKVWTGSEWTLKPVKVWTGSSWIEKPVKFWNGSSWTIT
jgi:hypothetical protein